MQLCNNILLNEALRQKYNAALLAAYPALQTQLNCQNTIQPAAQKPNKTKWHHGLKYLLLIIVFMMIGSGGYAAYHYYPIYAAQKAVKERLQNAESVRFYDLNRYISKQGKTTHISGYYNAILTECGSSGKRRFVYRIKDQKIWLIPNQKPDDFDLEIRYSNLWRIFHEHQSPEKMTALLDQMANNNEKFDRMSQRLELLSNEINTKELNEEDIKHYETELEQIKKLYDAAAAIDDELTQKLSIYPQ
ncbi:hypothetical protein PT286_08865 [Neisseriaceae bacterium ESL0693]|nr:hypothetical protein [Neisseriaceae bacterium ESL0693]